MTSLWFALPLVLLFGCGTPGGAQPASTADARPPLVEVFDLVRERGGVFVAAHRGGPGPGFPENALETLQNGLQSGLVMFEIDVAESQDGVLYLMHDRSLRRTGGYDGGVADTDWDVVRTLDLRDPDGTPTGFHPPRLADVLAWARTTGALLELDRKDTTSFRNIIDEVRAAGAEQHVLLITYNDDEAAEVARLAPDLMMTVGVRSLEQLEGLVARGVDPTRVVAWLGTREPDPVAMAVLATAGVESAFGTLGRPGQRLDDLYTEDGDGAEYRALVEQGVTLLATDRPFFVADELDADERASAVLFGASER